MNIWSPHGYHVFGRNGQQQHGADVIADCINAPLIQCKNYHNNNKSTISKFIKEIESDYSTASTFFNYSKFVVFTSLNRDVKISLDKLYLQEDKKIIVYFWEEITDCILSHSDLLKTFYPFYFNHEDFEIMLSQEDDYVNKAIKLIKSNIKTLENIRFNTTKSSDYYNGVDFYNEYVEMERQFPLSHSKKTDYIRHFFVLVEDLLHIMALNSHPNPYNPEERVLNRTISNSTITDFNDKIDIAKKLLSIIMRFDSSK